MEQPPSRPADLEIVPKTRSARLISAHWPVALLTTVAFVAYLVLSLARLYRWSNPSWDLAIFEQAVRGYANLGAPIVDIKGPGFNQLGDHFSPLLAIIAPFYRIFPTPATLLVAQCVLIAVSIVPITVVARRLLGNWSGLAVGFAYAFSWGIQSAIDVQFHEYALAVPLLAFGLAAFLTERWRASAIWIVLLLGVKEDLGLTVAAFGLLLLWRGQRRLGVIVTAAGVLGMALIVGVIIPAFNPNGKYDYWGKLDEDGSGSTGTLSSLVRLVTDFFSPSEKLGTIFLLLLITGFIALRSPIILLVVPTIIWRFAGSTSYYWGTSWHYSVILMPIMFAATIDGIVRLRQSKTPILRQYAQVVPALVAGIALVLVTSYPLRDLWNPQTYQRSSRVAVGEQILDLIPDGSTVASDTGLIVQLTRDHDVFWLGADPEVRPDYVVIDEYTWGGNPPSDLAAWAEAQFPGTVYEIVFSEDYYSVARRVSG